MLRSQSRLRPVPPSPEVFARLYMEFVRNGKPAGLTFAQYLRAIGFTDPSDDIDGMDDSATALAETPGGPALISVPQQKVVGLVTIIVLLIDFDDLPGQRPAQEFEDLLFSDSVYPTGSLRDYFREVSAGKVAVSGTVHGWMRMPKSYSFYTNNESGMKGTSYPRNAQRMAEDAVAVAIADGVVFPATLDVLHTGAVTGLFLIHAGRGAEELSPPMSKQQIWSHKWFLPNPATVNTNLVAGNYLTVPEDCNMGVCAHELGHLAFQWEDFYDTDKALNGQWAGTGSWDLMAGGSWNGFRGDTPAHPIGLHKSQHGWLTPQVITQTTTGVAIPPTSATNGNGVKVIGPAFTATQFLYLENRQRAGFDKALPGDGLLVWRVDLDRLQVGPARPAVQLVQADGRADLESNLNQGDEGDPFPGTALRTSVGDAPGLLTTTFPFAQASGITLSAIVVDAQTGVITLNITIGAANLPMMAQAVHAAPVDPMATALDRLLAQPNVSQSELEPFVRQASPTLLDIERRAFSIEPQSPEEAAPGEQPASSGKKKTTKKTATKSVKPATAEAALAASDPSAFGGWLWRRYKNNFGVQWDVRGKFLGKYTLEIRGPKEYLYIPDAADPFRFVRANGETTQPGKMITDGGSVPRAAWLIPDIDPWTYFDAYVIHDWDFMSFHCIAGAARTFEQANLTLAEGIYSLMMAGKVDADWRKVELVYQSVSTFVGVGVWNRQWSLDECSNTLVS